MDRAGEPAPGEGELVTVRGLVLRIDSRGLTVEGPRPNVVHTVSWQRVRSIEAGRSAMFEEGEQARLIQVELDDRRVQFLVPEEVLGRDQLRVLDTIVRGRLGSYLRVPPEPVPERAPTFTSGHPDARAPRAEPVSQARPQASSDARRPLQAPVLRSPHQGALRRRTHGPGLPPPPPSSSVVMPPKPADAGNPDVVSAKEPTGISGTLQDSFGIDKEFLLPPAVPAARRVHAPVHRPLQAMQPVPDSRRVPPLLPPPPPGGSSSKLPPSPVQHSDTGPEVGLDRVEETPRVTPLAPPTSTETPWSGAPAAPVTDAATTVAATTAVRMGGDRKSRRGRRRWSRRATVSGGVLLIAAAAVGGSLFGLALTDNGRSTSPSTQSSPGPATRASSGGSSGSLSGSSNSVGAGTIAALLNIAPAELPAGWTAGKAPWARVATQQSDAALAVCLGLPVSHVGILSGNTQPGGPQVASSRWFTSLSGASGFETYVLLTQAVTTEESDLAVLSGSRTDSCLQGWFASLDRSGDQIVGVPTVSSVAMPAVAGERAVGFRAEVVTRIKSADVQVNEELVVLGAGRTEVGLVSESIGSQVNPPAESSQLKGLEHRLRSVPSS